MYHRKRFAVVLTVNFFLAPVSVRHTSRSEPIKKSARDGCRVRTLLGVKGVKPLCGATEVKCLNDQKRSFSGGYEAARSLNAR